MLNSVELQVEAGNISLSDPDDKRPIATRNFTSLPHNATFPSHPVLWLQNTRCPSFIWQYCQCLEQLRWKLSTCSCLLYHPLKSRNTQVFDIILFVIFILFETLFFVQEMLKETNNGSVTASFRTFSIVFGRMSVFTFAIAWTLATRNSFWYLLIGIPFERALFYHIWIARFAIFLIWMHFIFMIYYWFDVTQTIDNITENLLISTNIAGLIAFIAATFIFVLSLNWCRRKYWEFFLKSHWILFLLFFYFAIKHHYAYFWHETYWMKVAIMCWSLDVLYRIYISLLRPLLYKCLSKGDIRVICLQSLPDHITKLTLQMNTHYMSCAAAQYCFICIPAVSVTEWHPFSVATNYVDTDSNTESITFYIRSGGDWTDKLERLALQCSDESIRDSLRYAMYRNIAVFIEGPYGKLAYQIEKYESIVLIGGGIGLTPIHSLFDHLMHYLYSNNIKKMKRIHFVWMARKPHEDIVTEFNQIHWRNVQSMQNKDGFCEAFFLNKTSVITNYYFNGYDHDKEEDIMSYSVYSAKYGNGVHFDRANLVDIIDKAKNHGSCAVFACGPFGLMKFIEKKCIKDGIHCHTEVFHF